MQVDSNVGSIPVQRLIYSSINSLNFGGSRGLNKRIRRNKHGIALNLKINKEEVSN